MLKRILGNKNIFLVALIVIAVIVGTILLVSFLKDTEETKNPTMKTKTEQNQEDKDEHMKEDVQSNSSTENGESNKSDQGLRLDVAEKDETVKENSTMVPDIWDDDETNNENNEN